MPVYASPDTVGRVCFGTALWRTAIAVVCEGPDTVMPLRVCKREKLPDAVVTSYSKCLRAV